MSFTWIPIYSEIARKVLAFESRQDELLDLLREMRSEGMKVILLNDRDAEGARISLEEIDPFTFFASFNRTSSVSGRQAMLAKIKGAWDLSSAVPDDFDGIPLANAQNSWSFGYREGRGEGDVGLLWRVAKAAIGASWRSFDWGLFDQALGIRQMGFAKLTTSLFWVEPMGFLPGDKHTEAYFRQRGIVLSSRTGAGYAAWLDAVESKAGSDFPQFSWDAYLESVVEEGLEGGDEGVPMGLNEGDPGDPGGPRFVRFFGPVLDALRDLGGEGTPKAVTEWIGERMNLTEEEKGETISSGVPRLKNRVEWARFYLSKAGLIELAKRGVWRLTPDGEQARPTIAESLEIFRRVREVMKDEASEQDEDGEAGQAGGEAEPRRYWTWSAGAGGEHWEALYRDEIAAIGWDEMGDLRGYSDKGAIHERLKELWPADSSKKNDANACWQFAHEMGIGDVVFAKQGFSRLLGYGVVEGEYEFDVERAQFKHVRRVKWLRKGQWEMPADSKMAMKTLTDITQYRDLVQSIAAMVGYDIGSGVMAAGAVPFTRAEALLDLFMSAEALDGVLARLRRKKALILQGPPGVGKTFVARRLAFALMGERDERRVATVQFHPSYGYEDFVQGFRPSRTGLERRDGVLHQFARLARNDPGRDWFFIIDEINRGNLAKIFGELLMLIESDKRGPEHAIPLTYSEGPEEKFYLPKNLYFIGTMNTADRSLAMVDYALRRRFAFLTVEPAMDSPEFAGWMKKRGASEALIARIRRNVGELNAVIEKERDLGPGFRVGHSFFCPQEGDRPDELWYREVIAGEIRPLLEEYFDSGERVRKLVAELLAD